LTTHLSRVNLTKSYLFGKIGGGRFMEIKYENGRVQKAFSDYSVLSREIGFEITKALKKRIDQLKASVDFQRWLDARLGKPHLLTGNEKRYYGVSITANVRLILRPGTNDHSPESLSTCKVVIVKGVGDYHGGKTNWIIA
jgi:proteic killer suppression protein/toxin YoeB